MADKKAKANTQPPVWEWVVAAVGMVLVFTAVGAALYRAMTQDASPPNFEMTVSAITPSQNGYVVAFRIKNTGSQTAGSVNVEANLMNGGEKIETATATLAYVPAHSERQGGVLFTNDPRSFELQVRALGYEKP